MPTPDHGDRGRSIGLVRDPCREASSVTVAQLEVRTDSRFRVPSGGCAVRSDWPEVCPEAGKRARRHGDQKYRYEYAPVLGSARRLVAAPARQPERAAPHIRTL